MLQAVTSHDGGDEESARVDDGSPELVSSPRLFIVQHRGPLAFDIKEDAYREGAETENGAQRRHCKYRTTLGTNPTCSCCHVQPKGFCYHVSWLLRRKFRVPEGSDILKQTRLTERDISALLEATTGGDKKANATPDMSIKSTAETTDIQPRPLHPDDVCPICMENLLPKGSAPDDKGKGASHKPGGSITPLTFCKHCRNSMHVRCAQMVLQYQSKSIGEDGTLPCPMCRQPFGTVRELRVQLEGAAAQGRREVKRSLRKQRVPHNGPRHSQVEPAAPKLTADAINALQSRDLTPSDYELLLQLDTAQDPDSSLPTRDIPDTISRITSRKSPRGRPRQDQYRTPMIPLHIVGTFYSRTLKHRDHLVTNLSSCGLCSGNLAVGDTVRVLPCGCEQFHRTCIDRALLRAPNCPTCSAPAYEQVSEDGDPTLQFTVDLNAASYVPVPYAKEIGLPRTKKRSKRQSTGDQTQNEDVHSIKLLPTMDSLMITGRTRTLESRHHKTHSTSTTPPPRSEDVNESVATDVAFAADTYNKSAELGSFGSTVPPRMPVKVSSISLLPPIGSSSSIVSSGSHADADENVRTPKARRQRPPRYERREDPTRNVDDTLLVGGSVSLSHHDMEDKSSERKPCEKSRGRRKIRGHTSTSESPREADTTMDVSGRGMAAWRKGAEMD
ncbi:hypothetical protein M427DRAFT_61990 [Gonapodya prolifera JEL478]|uniref:RING-type domain-containing protein n=1 Tax=Gonapodya prolifera (strain JEL478) TaxID=1344416 RepID=A0A139A105_GONPJ|nr:hypothetical protein M427DRAFT_61990 [Gonapodya prolifera JEL478]|eukprot:KXS10460.1 hypothetical protein M427DRAFT_61990 [Gonapodya prolifera JEL478]